MYEVEILPDLNFVTIDFSAYALNTGIYTFHVGFDCFQVIV